MSGSCLWLIASCLVAGLNNLLPFGWVVEPVRPGRLDRAHKMSAVALHASES